MIIVGRVVSVALVVLLGGSAAWAETWAIDQKRSTLTVYVFKSGLFSAFADDHVIRAPIAAGTVEDGDTPRVEVAVRAKEIVVLDPDLSAGKRAQVQRRMLGPEVLDADRFAEICFRSKEVKPLADGGWRVEGTLSLHGHSEPLSFEVKGANGHFRGSATIKQRSFGIEPISIVGGTVKVKDEVRVDFEIYTQAGGKPAEPEKQ